MAASCARLILGKQWFAICRHSRIFTQSSNGNCRKLQDLIGLHVQNRSVSVFSALEIPHKHAPQVSVTTTRSYSKGKERGDKKKKPVVVVDENEISELINVSKLKEDLQRSLDNLKADYVKNLTIRSGAGSIESLPVEFEGETYALQEIAQIGRKGPQLLVVNLSSFPQAIKNVMKSINDSGMGLNPQQDGTTLFIPIPKVTREFRENLAKNAKLLFQKFKDHSRDIQNRYIREVKKKEKEFATDLVFSVQQQIHTITEQFVQEAEKVMIAKQNELLGSKD